MMATAGPLAKLLVSFSETKFQGQVMHDDFMDEAQVRTEREVRRFITDPRHLDYECNVENKERLLDYLEAHDLPITAAALHVAYEELKEDGTLEVALPAETVPLAPVTSTFNASTNRTATNANARAIPATTNFRNAERACNQCRWSEKTVSKKRKSRKGCLNKVGKKFSRLTVLQRTGRDKTRYATWRCVCDCGNEKIIAGHELRRGVTSTDQHGVKSCGCLARELIASQGRSQSSEKNPAFKHGHNTRRNRFQIVQGRTGPTASRKCDPSKPPTSKSL
jgi:hypothetical protein